jgi:hypothetical protein
MLVQMASVLQLCVLRVHSFKSVQVTPLPVQPTLQAHVKDPVVLVHVAPMWQLCRPAVQKLISVQVTPLPV